MPAINKKNVLCCAKGFREAQHLTGGAQRRHLSITVSEREISEAQLCTEEEALASGSLLLATFSFPSTYSAHLGHTPAFLSSYQAETTLNNFQTCTKIWAWKQPFLLAPATSHNICKPFKQTKRAGRIPTCIKYKRPECVNSQVSPHFPKTCDTKHGSGESLI